MNTYNVIRPSTVTFVVLEGAYKASMGTADDDKSGNANNNNNNNNNNNADDEDSFDLNTNNNNGNSDDEDEDEDEDNFNANANSDLNTNFENTCTCPETLNASNSNDVPIKFDSQGHMFYALDLDENSDGWNSLSEDSGDETDTDFVNGDLNWNNNARSRNPATGDTTARTSRGGKSTTPQPEVDPELMPSVVTLMAYGDKGVSDNIEVDMNKADDFDVSVGLLKVCYFIMRTCRWQFCPLNPFL